jgi:hypothetical protein
MSQNQIILQAKQGDSQAIETLLNYFLNPKGITAKVNMKNNSLKIVLESAQMADKDILSAWVEKTIISLEIFNIDDVKVYFLIGKNNIPSWFYDFIIKKEMPIITENKEDNFLENPQLSKIQNNLTLAFKNKNIQLKLKLEKKWLQIILIAPEPPEKDSSMMIIKRELHNFKLLQVKIIKVYGYQINNDFPAWSEDLSLTANAQSKPIINNQKNHPQNYQINWQQILTLLGLLAVTFLGIDQLLHNGKHQITGGINITDYRYKSINNKSCLGLYGYSDINEGLAIVVKNKIGEILARGSLKAGQRTSINRCFFPIEVNNVPHADVYVIEIGNLTGGNLTYAKEELENRDWKIELSLGER